MDVNFAGALHARYDVLREQLKNNQFQSPLYLESGETSNSVKGDIYSLINLPFTSMRPALNSTDNWCNIMMLHLNTKYCRASTVNQQEVIKVRIGSKYDQPLNDAYPVVFIYRVVAQSPNYLQVKLMADEGPLGTRDYHVVLEAVPLGIGQTFLRLSYSYGYGIVGRLAMQVYLGTIGKHRAGFTVIGKNAGGDALYIGGMRGVVERNAMRYYLAIEAYVGALGVPLQARLEKSLRDWFAGIERYPAQLHEMELNEYLDMKRKEFSRQQTGTLSNGQE